MEQKGGWESHRGDKWLEAAQRSRRNIPFDKILWVGTEVSTAHKQKAECQPPTRRFRYQFPCFFSGGGCGRASNSPEARRWRTACCSEPLISTTNKWDTAIFRDGAQKGIQNLAAMRFAETVEYQLKDSATFLVGFDGNSEIWKDPNLRSLHPSPPPLPYPPHLTPPHPTHPPTSPFSPFSLSSPPPFTQLFFSSLQVFRNFFAAFAHL